MPLKRDRREADHSRWHKRHGDRDQGHDSRDRDRVRQDPEVNRLHEKGPIILER